MEWIGAIPDGWRILAMKHLVSMRSGEQITSEHIEETGDYPVFGGNGLRGYTTTFTHDGDFALIGRQGALCGNINYGHGKFWASEHAVVVTPRVACATFWLGELLRAMDLGQYSVTAAQPGLAVEVIGNLRIPVPSLSEQSAISAFLDHETAKIDALVAEQERLIALLKEKRQAVISHAVTKGLDSNAPMKDSGVEWLGQVPAHWNIKALRSLAREGRDSFIDGDWIESPYITDDGIRLIQTGNIGVGNYKEQGFRFITEKTFVDLHCTEVQPGDVLICRLAEPVGRACIAPDIGCRMITSVDVCILKASDTAFNRYVVYLLSSAQYLGFMEGQCRGGTRDRVSRSFLGATRVAVPPLHEQVSIVSFLDGASSRLDILITEAIRAISLLRERRAALISAAVTGKIDVRNFVPLERRAA